jgi:hypothetical protein
LGAGYILWEFTRCPLNTVVFGFRNQWQYPARWIEKACTRLELSASIHEPNALARRRPSTASHKRALPDEEPFASVRRALDNYGTSLKEGDAGSARAAQASRTIGQLREELDNNPPVEQRRHERISSPN